MAVEVSRSNQIEGRELDHQVSNVFSNQIKDALKYFPNFSEKFAPELDLSLRSILLYASFVKKQTTTFGLSLENLVWKSVETGWENNKKIIKYRNPSRRKKAMMALLFLGAPYLWAKISQVCRKARWQTDESNEVYDRLWQIMNKLENIYNILVLLNFIIFLKNGRYSTLTARLLNVRLMYLRQGVSRNASYEFMNRELIWQHVTDFVLLVAPLFDMTRLRRRVSRALLRVAPSTKQSSPPTTLSSSVDNTPTLSLSKSSLAFELNQLCAVCGETPAGGADAVLQCGHVACYWCECAERNAGGGVCNICAADIV